MKHLSHKLDIECAQLSEAGKKPVNEDSIGIRMPDGSLQTHKGTVAVIADGVSSAEAGMEASQACVQNLLYDYYCTPETWSVEKSITSVLNALNRWLYSQGSYHIDESKGYITTLSILILKSSTAHLFHIGDSRIYLMRSGKLECLTTDHTRKVGDTTYLARAMGLDNKIQLDHIKVPLDIDDRFFLSTDGVHDFLPHTELEKLLANDLHRDEIVKAIHKKALESGSDDNLSSQIVDVLDLNESSRDEIYQRLTHLPFPPLFDPGHVVDDLLVERSLYESNRSQLYLVKDQLNDERYVLKTPSVNFEDDPSYIERFTMESWVGKKFRHSKLVKIAHRDIQPSYLYYLMEYVPGISLDKWMEKHAKPSLDRVVRIARQIGLGLRALHRHQVVHQDLKPANIILDDNEQVKLVDFGSCAVSSLKEHSAIVASDYALGTACYSAPECHLDMRVDERADVFSLAVIVFEMLTGSLPYQGKLTDLKKPSDLKRLRYVPASKINPFLPVWIDVVLKKALSFNIEERYQDVDEFLTDLEKPNRKLLAKEQGSLIERNPNAFWKGLAVVQLVIIIILLSLQIS